MCLLMGGMVFLDTRDNMQVDCYKRNWQSKVCSTKCKFRAECERAYRKDLLKIIKEVKNG